MSKDVSLITIDHEGVPRGYAGGLSEKTAKIIRLTVKLYESVGFIEPWVCYLAIFETTLVGTCGFKSIPHDGRVEIAYFTFPEFENRGFASAMAAQLVTIAKRHQPSILVTAQTLPERNASHRILEKLGFNCVGKIEHPEDGTVCEWQLTEDYNAKKESNRITGP